MAINLDRHKKELVEAWQDVLSDKTDTDWALFSYEGQTNDLKVAGKGSGGIEELVEDLNSGKVMYAFVKVSDPSTSLPKCVLINWQGEGANTVRKGICANHLRDVEGFFKGANVTINARTEDEVDVQIVRDKLAKAGSSYSFDGPRCCDRAPSDRPVGSNYKPVNPLAEINSLERDQFWMRQEKEERDRVAEEARRRDEERLKREEEARRRDAAEAERRDAATERRNSGIDEIRRAEVGAAIVRTNEENVVAEEAKVNRSDELRQQRNREAQNLIAQRTIDARSIFERNTSAGQVRKTPEKPVRTSILKAQQQQQKVEEERRETVVQKVEVVQTKQATEESDDECDQFATIKRSPKDVETKKASSPTIERQEVVKNSVVQENRTEQPVQQITEQQFVDEVLYGDLVDSGIRARALYDYQAADDTEITFDPGDVITHIELVDEGWWQGLGPDGTYGLFPANYVEII